MFKYVKVRTHFEHMRQKSSKNMLIVKFHPGLTRLFSFFSSQDEKEKKTKLYNKQNKVLQ